MGEGGGLRNDWMITSLQIYIVVLVVFNKINPQVPKETFGFSPNTDGILHAREKL